MSFDWLNVPGLNINDPVADAPTATDGTPPSVSFDFNQTIIQGNQQPNTMVPPKKNNPFANHMNNVQTANQQQGLTNQQAPQSNIQTPPINNNNNATDSQHNEDGYVEANEDLQVPLSLSQLQLTHEEMRTYLRWYKYITTRTHGKLVRLSDVFKFLHNFNITDKLKERIVTIFRTCKNSLNIGQFFAVLRLISLAVGRAILPTRRMILEKATVPKPKPILNSQTDGEVYEEVDEEEGTGNKPDDSKVDFDSFTSLLLTGKSTRKRIRRRIKNAVFRNKKVRFSEHITFQEPQQENIHEPQQESVAIDSSTTSEEGPLDLSLPMDQLLKVMAKRKEHNTSLISKVPTEQQETEEEKEELRDMQDSLSHFKQIRGPDSASLIPAAYLESNGSMGVTPQQLPLEPLKPTSTGSANHFMRQEYNADYGTQNFSNQPVMEPLKPTATGSANYLMRSHQGEPPSVPSVSFQQNNGAGNVPQIVEPLKPTATGSANYLMKQHVNPGAQMNISPNPTAGTAPVQQDQFMNFPQHRAEIQNQQIQSQQVQQSQPQPQQQQIPNHSLAQQNTYQTGNYNLLQPQQSLSQQNTMNHSNGMLTQQATYPLNERVNMNYLSPQHTQQQHQQQQHQQQQQQQQQHQQPVQQQNTVQNNNMLSAPNAANNYFQSLLSHTPSPNGSNSNLPNSNNLSRQYNQAPTNIASPQIPQQNTLNSTQPVYSGMNNNNNANSYQQNKPMQQVQHTGNVNNGYQMIQPKPQQQPQAQQQQRVQYMLNPAHSPNNMQPQSSGQQGGSNAALFGNPVQSPVPNMATNQQQTNQGQYLAPNQYGIYGRSNTHSPINGQPNGPISSTSSGGQNILGNYQALQQQVNVLQNRYR